MKKILIALVAIASLSLQAQTYTITYNGMHDDTVTGYYSQANMNLSWHDTVNAGDSVCLFYDFSNISLTGGLAIRFNSSLVGSIPFADITGYQVGAGRYFYYWKIPINTVYPATYQLSIGTSNSYQFWVLGVDSSNEVPNDVGISELWALKTVDHTEFYDLAGRNIPSPDSGIYLRFTYYTDSTVRREKIFASGQ